MSKSTTSREGAAVVGPEASTSTTPLAPQQPESQPPSLQQVRKGTKQEAFESRGKKGTSGPTATSRALIYNTPLPLYLSQGDTALLYSLSWTISLASQVILAQFRAQSKSRNRVPKEAYLEEKIQAYWDARTKSVWVLPTRKNKSSSKGRRKKRSSASDGSQAVASTSGTLASLTEEEGEAANNDDDEEEEEQTPWMDLLWKRGFFGKGSLSRSEPTWWQREKNRVTGEHVPTAEDITSARRADRVVHKKQKAQERADEKEKQALALAEQRKRKHSSTSDIPEAGPSSSEAAADMAENAKIGTTTEEGEQDLVHILEPATNEGSSVHEGNLEDAAPTSSEDVTPAAIASPAATPTQAQAINKARGMPTKTKLPDVNVATLKQEAKMKELSIAIPNLEYTQLQREEAFFIALSSGSIDVYERVPTASENPAKPMHLFELWMLFTRASLDLSAALSELELKSALQNIRPDNPFIISYVVYHHYRSLGWVVRNGVKFCVDWVLYKGADGVENPRGGAGPVGGHAEFAVAIIPTYRDPADAPSSAHLKYRRDWRWLNTVNRVCSGVKKTVVLTYVTIPRMRDFASDKEGNLIDWTNPGCLKHYDVKEVSIKRFIPTRMRD